MIYYIVQLIGIDLEYYHVSDEVLFSVAALIVIFTLQAQMQSYFLQNYQHIFPADMYKSQFSLFRIKSFCFFQNKKIHQNPLMIL